MNRPLSQAPAERGDLIGRELQVAHITDLLQRPDTGLITLTGPGGTRTYAQLCAEAAQWGHGFQSLGLRRVERILMFLDDTPAYPAAFFGAVRSGFVPLLINTLTPPDLLDRLAALVPPPRVHCHRHFLVRPVRPVAGNFRDDLDRLDVAARSPSSRPPPLDGPAPLCRLADRR